MVAGHAQVLQALMAVRAQHEISLDGVSAVGAFTVLHEFALLERDLEFLLVAIDLQQRRTEQAVGNYAHERHKRNDSPDVPE